LAYLRRGGVCAGVDGRLRGGAGAHDDDRGDLLCGGGRGGLSGLLVLVAPTGGRLEVQPPEGAAGRGQQVGLAARRGAGARPGGRRRPVGGVRPGRRPRRRRPVQNCHLGDGLALRQPSQTLKQKPQHSYSGLLQRNTFETSHCNFLRKHFQPFSLNLVLPSVVKPSGARHKAPNLT